MSNHFLTTQVGYVYLPTTNIERTTLWYTQNLGLRLIQTFEDRGSLISILHFPHKHAIAIVLVETTEDRPLSISRNGSPYPVLTMNCPDIEYTHQYLSDHQVEVQEIRTLGNGEAKYFYFQDDQGNLLEAAWSQWDAADELKDSFLN